ncbi:rhodanese-like domain-containing protein [Brevibacillus choshinensis]|uniref:Rhodanese-like domain-containing protein n=1 Tax=Brevibacillus choshinensis TaxID=54911 RepID=A0ABX7FX67_BRECH|nr:rhodanese-like domain-containing protein [Brevibacillus choshinensis]QRG70388.1 rhodanese-like domain-containing protein [Brevibacillus choshinensis]
MQKETISCSTFRKTIQEESNLLLVDVRDEEKFLQESLHIEGIETKNAPYVHMKEQDQPFDEKTSHTFRDATIITVCTTGNKAQKAAALLREKGYRALALEGGLTAWNDLKENR